MKRIIALVLICLLTMVSVMASCEELAIINQDSITVSGIAIVSLDPDYADLYLGTDTYHANLADAVSEYEGKISSLTAAMKEYDIPEEDIQIEPYTVTIIYSTSSETATSAPRIRGYRLVNRIIVRTKNVMNVGAVIDKANSSGSDKCDSVLFGSTVADTAYDEALAMAIQEAYRKAVSMAKISNATVGKVMSMSENSGSYKGIKIKKSIVDGQTNEKTEFLFDNLDFKASVTITYELE